MTIVCKAITMTLQSVGHYCDCVVYNAVTVTIACRSMELVCGKVSTCRHKSSRTL